MEKERGAKIIAIVALLIAVVGLTVGYAAYSTTLTIDGTANVDPASWDIHFANLGTVAKTGNAVENTAPTLAATTISGFDVTLKAPGDSVTYTFDVTNAGTLNATLTTFTQGTLTCAPASGSSATQEEATNICNELQYTITGVTQGEALNATATKNLTLKLEWPSTSTLQVTDKIAVTVGTTTLLYDQA